MTVSTKAEEDHAAIQETRRLNYGPSSVVSVGGRANAIPDERGNPVHFWSRTLGCIRGAEMYIV